MPRGVYTRTPSMKTYGKTVYIKDKVLALKSLGFSVIQIADLFKLNRQTVYKILNNDWGNHGS